MAYSAVLPFLLPFIRFEREGLMEFKVEIYIGDKLIPQDKVPELVINNPVIDRIVNNAAERA